MKRPGQLVEFLDGSKGIAYNDMQIHKEKLVVSCINADFSPKMSLITGLQKVLFKEAGELKLIGFID